VRNLKLLTGLDDFLKRDSSQLADSLLVCPICGEKHSIPFATLSAGVGVLGDVPDMVMKTLGRRPRKAGVIYDKAIENLVESEFFSIFSQKGLDFTPISLGAPGFHLDSESNMANQAANAIDPNIDILIAAGSGVICDTTKWIATRLKKPFILCGSAPSMNGYTSITATMTENGIKTTRYLNPAQAVVLDVNVVSRAPKEMVWAGLGDLAARAICNADWKLSNYLKGSYFCDLPYQMTAQNERNILECAAGLGRREGKAIHSLSEAILMSGLSMTILDGETSPSSGGEHVISHFWDFLVHLRGLVKNLHGTQVGVGTMMMLALYEVLKEIDPGKIDPLQLLRNRLSVEQLEAENLRIYGSSAEAFNLAGRKKRVPDDQFVEYIKSILANWDHLIEVVFPYAASLESIRVPLVKAGVPLKLSDISRTYDQGKEALTNSCRYRTRYTALDLATELGILPAAADEILQRAQVI
jgi:glycerol-1-phosphate dehydrogenase [NAD(P)+]